MPGPAPRAANLEYARSAGILLERAVQPEAAQRQEARELGDVGPIAIGRLNRRAPRAADPRDVSKDVRDGNAGEHRHDRRAAGGLVRLPGWSLAASFAPARGAEDHTARAAFAAAAAVIGRREDRAAHGRRRRIGRTTQKRRENMQAAVGGDDDV